MQPVYRFVDVALRVVVCARGAVPDRGVLFCAFAVIAQTAATPMVAAKMRFMPDVLLE